MSTPPKKRFGSQTLSQPAAPTPDELMFGPVAPATVPGPSPSLEPAPQAPVAGPTGRWVPFGSYVRDQTYLQLKQAEYWEPGFEIRQFLEDAIQEALRQLPAAQRPLPAAVLDRLLRTNKKLRSDPSETSGPR
jgi:hypothetical protein